MLTGLAAALRAGLRAIAVCAALGALVGLAWGLADEPVYSASATVVISDRGEAVDSLGGGVVGNGGSGSDERLLALAGSNEVARLAAESLGGDVSGADLLSRTTFRTGPEGGTVVIDSSATFPDFAAATADAYAEAISAQIGRSEKRRIERLREEAEEELALVDPLSEEGIELTDRLQTIDDLESAGDPVTVGSRATLPATPQSDRSASRSALLGLGAGALLAILFLIAAEIRRRPIRTPSQLADAAGSEPAGLLGPGDAARPAGRPSVFGIEPVAADRSARIARELGLDRTDAPSTVAVASAMPGEGRTSLALGLAAAAAGDGISALLMEADMRRPAVGSLLGLGDGPGLSDYLAGAATPREVINAVSVARGDASGELPSFVAVTAGTRTEAPDQMLSSDRFRRLLDQLRRVYELVLFDCPALLPAPEGIVVSEATDATVLVVRSGVTRRAEVGAALELLEGSGVEPRGTVLTGATHRGAGVRRLGIARGSRFAEPRVRH